MSKYAMAMRQASRDFLQRKLDEAHGNRTMAAKLAGLNRTHFMRLMSSHGLTVISPLADPKQWRQRKPDEPANT